MVFSFSGSVRVYTIVSTIAKCAMENRDTHKLPPHRVNDQVVHPTSVGPCALNRPVHGMGRGNPRLRRSINACCALVTCHASRYAFRFQFSSPP